MASAPRGSTYVACGDGSTCSGRLGRKEELIRLDTLGTPDTLTEKRHEQPAARCSARSAFPTARNECRHRSHDDPHFDSARNTTSTSTSRSDTASTPITITQQPEPSRATPDPAVLQGLRPHPPGHSRSLHPGEDDLLEAGDFQASGASRAGKWSRPVCRHRSIRLPPLERLRARRPHCRPAPDPTPLTGTVRTACQTPSVPGRR